QAFFFSHTTHTTVVGSKSSTATVVTAVNSNAIYVDSNLTVQNSTPTKITLSPADTSLHAGNFPVSLGLISGIAVDTVSEKLYFTTDPVQDPVAHTFGTGGIYEYDLSQGTSGTYNAIWVEPSSGSLFLSYIQIDHATNRYYVTGNQSSDVNPSVYDGALSGGTTAQSPTLFANLTMTSITQNVQGLAIDNAPTLAITPANTTFTESTSNPASSNNTPVSVISAATASDSDNTAVFSATVSVGSFFAGDVLSDTTTGTRVTSSYNTTNGVLTLTGVDTFAHYQTVLSSVKFTSTSENPTDFGSDNSRTLSFSINDGLLTSAPQTATVSVVGVNDPPTATVAATASFTEKAGAKTLSSAAVVSDPDSLTFANATVKITAGTFAGDGDVLAATTSGTSITASYNSTTETLTLSGSDTLAHYQSVLRSVTFNQDPNLNPTNYASNTTRTVTRQVNDSARSAQHVDRGRAK